MKIFKRIYLCVLPVLMALVITVGFINAYYGGRGYKGSDAFVSGAKFYANNLITRVPSNYTPNANKTDDSDRIRGNLNYYLSSSEMKLSTVVAEYNSTNMLDDEGKVMVDDDGNTLRRYSIVSYRTTSSDEINYPEMSYYDPSSNNRGFVVSDETIQKITEKRGDDSTFIPVDRIVNNIVVTVPGQKTKDNAAKLDAYNKAKAANPTGTHVYPLARADAPDAILITVHMDFARGSAGGTDLAALGTVLNEIYRLKSAEALDKSKAQYKNDIIFLFTDARYDAAYGSYTFIEQFFGFEIRDSGNKLVIPDIVSRIKLCVNLDSVGGGSSSLLLQTSTSNANVVKGFAKAVGASSSSFISDIYSNFPSDFNAFDGYNAVNLVTFGNTKKANTQYQTLSSVPDSVFSKKAQMLLGTLDYFGSYDLDALDTDKNVEYFSVLGLFTISYSNLVSYIFGAIVLLLVIAIVIVNGKKKAYNYASIGKGILVQLLSIAAALLSMFVLYFFMGLLLAGFGVFTIQSLIGYAFTNAGVMLGYILLAAALLGLFYGIFKKFLAVKAASIVRGGAVIWILAGVVLAFAYPALGLIASISAALVALTMLLSAAYKEKFKTKFGFEIEGMFFYMIPMIFALMLLTPSFAILALTARAILMPIVILPFIMALSLIVPYVSALKPVMDEFLAKMPKRTIRVQRTVTEKIADKAKPGKYTEVTETKIVKEKIAWKYHSGVGAALVAVIACIVIMINSAFGISFGATSYATGKEAGYGVSRLTESIYDSSLLLVWEKTGLTTSSATTNLEIHDKAAYKYLRNAVNGYKWNMDKGAYTKSYDAGTAFEVPNFDNAAGTNKVKFVPAMFTGLGRGISEITITDASTITKVRVLDSNGVQIDDNTGVKAEYTNNGNKTLTLRLPADADKNGAKYDGFILEFDFTSSKASSFTISFKQYIYDSKGDSLGNLLEPAGIYDVRDINSYLDGLSDTARKSKQYGVVLNLEKTISI